jgi:hypothetical protein
VTLQLAKGVGAPKIAGVIPLTRYQLGGLERFCMGKQRPGAAEVLDDSQKQRLIAMVCSSPWERRDLLDGTSDRRRSRQTQAGSASRKGNHPNVEPRSETVAKRMCLAADLDDDYIAKMEDVLVYERPYDPRQPVICLDEKPITLHADLRPTRPAARGREARRDNGYERRGTANVFCAAEPKAGRHFTFSNTQSFGLEFAQVVFNLALEYPKAKTIHLVMDNLNIHGWKFLCDVCGTQMAARRSLRPIHGPVHAYSWKLAQSSRDRNRVLARQCLGSRRIPDL